MRNQNRVVKNGSKTVTLSQARKGRAKPPGNALRPIFLHGLPINVGLPGFLCVELSDVALLGFIAEVVAVDADFLRKKVVSQCRDRFWACNLTATIKLMDTLSDRYFSAAVARTPEESEDLIAEHPPTCWLPGLCRYGRPGLESLVYEVGHSLHFHNDLIEQEILERWKAGGDSDIGVLEWYQVLVVSEALTARAEGWRGDQSRLDQDLRRKVMDWQLRCHGADWSEKRWAA